MIDTKKTKDKKEPVLMTAFDIWASEVDWDDTAPDMSEDSEKMPIQNEENINEF